MPFQGKVGRWIRAYHLKVPPPPLPPQPPRGGPRKRLLPTPRGVNMIVWSLDNRFVLAAIMGNVLVQINRYNGVLWCYMIQTVNPISGKRHVASVWIYTTILYRIFLYYLDCQIDDTLYLKSSWTSTVIITIWFLFFHILWEHLLIFVTDLSSTCRLLSLPFLEKHTIELISCSWIKVV